MLAIAGVGTVMVAVPVAVPDRAVIVTVPAATPVTTPEPETVAIAALLVVQVTGAPAITLPFASRTVAVNDAELPMATVALAGVTDTLAAVGAFTVTVAVPLALPLVAVIVALPGPTPVTTPEAETVATAELLVVHVTVALPITFAPASRTVATNVVVLPTVSVAVAGETLTVAAVGTVTVTAAAPDFPSLVAVIVAVP